MTRLWRQTENRESAPPQPDFTRQTTDPLDDEATPDGTAAIDLPDPATLDVHSNYRPFLRETVPAELKRLALRRAWTSDPAIATFKGFADYDWDTNAAGYGWLRPADAAMAVATVLGQAERKPEEGSVAVAAAEIDVEPLHELEERVFEDQPRQDQPREDQPREEDTSVDRSSA